MSWILFPPAILRKAPYKPGPKPSQTSTGHRSVPNWLGVPSAGTHGWSRTGSANYRFATLREQGNGQRRRDSDVDAGTVKLRRPRT
jgi:hypothetical protein